MATRSRHPFTRRLERLLRRARLRTGATGVVGAVAGTCVIVGFAALAAGWPAAAGPAWRSAVGVVAVAAVVLLWLERVAAPLSDLGGRRRFGRGLDRAGGHRNLLVAAEEAERDAGRWSDDGVGGALRERLLAAAHPRLEAADPVRDLGLPRWPTALALGAAVLLIAGLPQLLVPGTLRTGMDRLLHPLDDDAWSPRAGLYVEAAPVVLTAGESLVVTAVDFGSPRGPVVCEVRTTHGGWRDLATHEAHVPSPSPLRRFQATLVAPDEDVVYRFTRDGMTTRQQRVRVVHPPLVAGVVLEVEPPAYTGLAAQVHDPWPSLIEAPVGSRLTWRGAATHDVTSVRLVTEGGEALDFDVDGAAFSGSLRLEQDLTARVELRDDHGLGNPDPLDRELRAIPDAPPVVWIARPDDDGRMPADGLVELHVLAEDDYGIAAVDLLVRHEGAWNAPADTTWVRGRGPDAGAPRTVDTGSGIATLALRDAEGAPGADRRTLIWELDVASLSVLPGETLLLAAEARDGRHPGPPGRTRSRVLRLTVPSAAELLGEQVATAEERQDDLDDLRRRGEEMAEDLRRIERELKKNPEMDFGRRQELEDAVERQQHLQEELAEVADRMRAEMGDLAERNLADPMLLEKMERVAELLEELQSEELRRLQEQLREAASELSEQEIRDAVAEISEQQQEYLERLDRAIAMLEDLRREQELAGLVASVEEMMRRQEDLIEETEGADSEQGGENAESDAALDAEEAARRQQELADEMAALEEKMQEAMEALQKDGERSGEQSGEQEGGEQSESEEGDSPQSESPEGGSESEESTASEAMREALEEAIERMKEQSAEQAMREAAQEMTEGESSPSDSQHEAMRRLASLFHVLMQGQQNMQMAMEQFVGDALRRLAGDLLNVSAREEALATSIPLDMSGIRAPELAREQMRLLRSLASQRDRLEEILADAPSLSQGLLKALDGIVDELDTTLGHLREGWGAPASRGARNGLGSMNSLVINLLTGAQNQGSGGGSCAMPSLGQQLEQMAREQAGLNSLADQLRGQQQGGRMSQEARAQMERLQQDQQGLAGRMAEAENESRDTPERERLLGDLEELAREMERVGDALEQGAVTEEILRRQERILGRLLDARNSVRRRDYERRRESLAAEDLFREQSGDDVDDPADEERERELRRRRQVEHVPPDYRDLVRRYFRSLGRNGASAEGGTP